MRAQRGAGCATAGENQESSQEVRQPGRHGWFGEASARFARADPTRPPIPHRRSVLQSMSWAGDWPRGESKARTWWGRDPTPPWNETPTSPHEPGWNRRNRAVQWKRAEKVLARPWSGQGVQQYYNEASWETDSRTVQSCTLNSCRRSCFASAWNSLHVPLILCKVMAGHVKQMVRGTRSEAMDRPLCSNKADPCE